MVDSPVSGGTIAADAGTLTFMVGGSADDFKRASTFLQCMGKKIVHCGALGSGQIAKVCNNMVLAISMIGVSEAMNVGVKLGMDPSVLASVINTSSGRCWSSDTYNPVVRFLLLSHVQTQHTHITHTHNHNQARSSRQFPGVEASFTCCL